MRCLTVGDISGFLAHVFIISVYEPWHCFGPHQLIDVIAMDLVLEILIRHIGVCTSTIISFYIGNIAGRLAHVALISGPRKWSWTMTFLYQLVHVIAMYLGA